MNDYEQFLEALNKVKEFGDNLFGTGYTGEEELRRVINEVQKEIDTVKMIEELCL